MKNEPHPVSAFKRFGILVLIMAPFAMAACNVGSNGGGIPRGASVKALSLPDRIELTQEEGQSAAGLFQAASGDAGSNHGLAAKRTRADDTDTLDMVNTILGVVKDTGYAGSVNQGPYLALVRPVDGSRQRPSGDIATSATTEQRMEIYVEVTRNSNSSPMIVKFWVGDKEGPGQGSILVRGYFSVTRGVSATYPYGVMFARLKGTALDSDGNEGADIFAMAMSVGAGGGNVITGDVGDRREGDIRETHRRVRVAADVDVTEGDACVYEAGTDWDDHGVQKTTHREAAFNPGYFKAADECRDPVYYAEGDLQRRIFRYQRFDADTGAAVIRTPDLQFEAGDDKHGKPVT